MSMAVHPWEFLAHCIILDILTIPDHQWGAALVYFTGDDIVSGPLPIDRPELRFLSVQPKHAPVSE